MLLHWVCLGISSLEPYAYKRVKMFLGTGK
jgi:hypothetical protein